MKYISPGSDRSGRRGAVLPWVNVPQKKFPLSRQPGEGLGEGSPICHMRFAIQPHLHRIRPLRPIPSDSDTQSALAKALPPLLNYPLSVQEHMIQMDWTKIRTQELVEAFNSLLHV